MNGLAKALVVLSVVVLVVGFIARLSGVEILPQGGALRAATYFAVLGIAVTLCFKAPSGA